MSGQNPGQGLVFRCLVCETGREVRDVPCETCGAADYLHVVEGDDLAACTPHALVTLIGGLIADAVADRLRERAQYHHTVAEIDAAPARRAWHREEADALEQLAARELAAVEAGDPR